ncbi:MAG: hypothetical protein KY395_00450 [Actinobacteria bacterium]|nr:hypothetical protein [Actinomycetota bacterium]
MSAPEEERSALDEALDLFIFAPIGLAVTAAEELPKIVERGREVVESRMGTARVLGRVAVNQGRVEVSRIVSQWNDLGSVLRSGAMTPSPKSNSWSGTDDEGRPAPHHDAAAPRAPRAQRMPAAPEGLGIPGYESLAATQVVSRLGGLTSDQLAAVKAYESATRGRRTILGRIAQIESAKDA